MINFLAAAGLIFLFYISAYGWGCLATVYIYKDKTQSTTFEATVGLAIWVFIGGILNALGVAYPLALDTIVVAGILFFVISIFRDRQKERGAQRFFFKKPGFVQDKIVPLKILAESLPIVLILSATTILVITLLPSEAFNYHDDFYKYLPRIYRMLDSGKLGGTPFDLIGLDSLGAHAFLQSFVAAHFPLKYLNGFDAVFCFLLGGLLLNDIGRRFEVHWLFRSGATAAYIIINPQYVNVSALYSGTLMILALLYSSLLLYEGLEIAEKKESILAAIPFALFISTVIGLKITFVPFAVLYFFVFFLLLICFASQRKNIVEILCFSSAATVISLMPWVWSVADKIIIFSQQLTNKINSVHLNQGNSELYGSIWENLILPKRLFYGNLSTDYTFIVLCVFAAAIWAGYFLIRKKEITNKGNFILLASAGISTLVAYLINAYLAREFYVGIRYTSPILLAIVPSMALFFAAAHFSKPVSQNRIIRANQIAVILALVISIGLFLNGWFLRLKNISEYRTMLSYTFDKKYTDYMSNSLSKVEQGIILSLQKKTQEQTTVLVWFEVPFWLDFSRNKIFTVDGPGLIMKNINPADGETLGSYLKSFNVRYVIFQYKGKAPMESRHNGPFRQSLIKLWRESDVIFNDGKRMVLDING